LFSSTNRFFIGMTMTKSTMRMTVTTIVLIFRIFIMQTATDKAMMVARPWDRIEAADNDTILSDRNHFNAGFFSKENCLIERIKANTVKNPFIDVA